MKNMIQPLSPEGRTPLRKELKKGAIEGDAGPVRGDVAAEFEQQRGSGFPKDEPLSTELVAAIDFHPEHHRTFWPLEKIYEVDPELALALSELDEEYASEPEGQRGYLEPEELTSAHGAEAGQAVSRFKKIELLSRKEHGFDPANLAHLREKHSEVARALESLDRPYSVKRGHSDSFKVGKLAPEMQARFRRVDQGLRAEDSQRDLADKERKIDKALTTIDVRRGEIVSGVGTALASIGAFSAVGAVASSGMAFALLMSGVLLILPSALFFGGSMDADGLTRRLGRGLRKLWKPKKARPLLEMKAAIAREQATLLALPPRKTSTNTGANQQPKK